MKLTAEKVTKLKKTIRVFFGMLLVCGLFTASPMHVFAVEEMNASGKVTNETLNIRSGPGTDNDVMGQLHEGDEVDITGEEDGWYRIEYDEEVGYVSAKYIEITEDSSALEDDEDIDDKDAEAEEIDEVAEDEETDGSLSGLIEDKQTFLIIGGVILVLIILIFATIKSIRNMSDEYDDYDDDDYDDEYDDYDEYDDRDRDDYDDDYEEDYEEDYEDDPVRYMSNDPNDYRIKIDPRYLSDD